MIGNPPWIKYKWDEMNVISDYEPLFVIRNYNSSQVIKQRKKLLADKETEKNYVNEYEKKAGMLCYFNAIAALQYLPQSAASEKSFWLVQGSLHPAP